MPHKIARLVAIGLLLGLGLSSCSYTSAQGRREAAYRHYLNKHIRERQKQIAKAQKAARKRAKQTKNPEPLTDSKPASSSGSVYNLGGPVTMPDSPAP